MKHLCNTMMNMLQECVKKPCFVVTAIGAGARGGENDGQRRGRMHMVLGERPDGAPGWAGQGHARSKQLAIHTGTEVRALEEDRETTQKLAQEQLERSSMHSTVSSTTSSPILEAQVPAVLPIFFSSSRVPLLVLSCADRHGQLHASAAVRGHFSRCSHRVPPELHQLLCWLPGTLWLL